MTKSVLHIITFFLLIQLGLVKELSAQQVDLKNAQSFGVNEGYERLYLNGVYFLKSISSGEIKDFPAYQYIGDVTNGSVIFKSKNGNYGVLNHQFDEVIKPEWIEIRDLGFGYFALAHYSGIMVDEDRGQGLKPYPQLTWRLYSTQAMAFVSDIELINPICIYGEVLAHNAKGDHLKIKLGKINLGYHDPLMKAVSITQKEEKSVEGVDFATKSK